MYSPLLANIAFHGMEAALGVRYDRKVNKPYAYEFNPKYVGLVRYADDFVVFCHTREQAEQARTTLATWFAARGLSFSPEKTRIVNLGEGFDFLGFNVRQYKVTNSRTGYRLLIRPSKKAVKEHRRKLKAVFRECHGYAAGVVIGRLNPVIRGWTNYFRMGVAARTFERLDDYLYTLQRRWVHRTHPTKPWKWRKARYWGAHPDHRGALWTFRQPGFNLWMLRHAWTPIKRHKLVRRFASWDDPDLQGYWDARMIRATGDSMTKFQRQIAKAQDWVCPICGDYLNNGEELHEHHKVPRARKGSNHPSNFTLLHLYCHQARHAKQEDST